MKLKYNNENHCAMCNAEIDEGWGDSEQFDESIRYEYTCDECGFEGYEWDSIVFCEHTAQQE